MTKPLISIITVVYNNVNAIEQTILSVITQTYANIEYIIIDGGSTDGTIDIINKYQDKITHWISEPDKGIYDAMNKGISYAKGDLINFINSGDSFYQSNILELLVSQMDTNADIIYGNTNVIMNIGEFIKVCRPLNLKNYMPFCHQAVFVRTEILRKQKFNPRYKVCADRDFFHQVYLTRKAIYNYIPITICNYEGDNGLSANAKIQFWKETYQIEGKESIRWKCHFFIVVILKEKARIIIKAILRKKLLDKIRYLNMRKFEH